MELYDRIGAGYDGTRRADPGIVAHLRALLRPEPGGRYLDLACGTGNYTCALAKGGGTWTGVDPSEVMLRAARARSGDVDWRRASADGLPFGEARFDGVVCTLAVHHFPDREAAFREARRVLGSGPFVLFVCEAGRTGRFWLREYFPHMFERIASKEPSETQMLAALRSAGFTKLDTEPWFVPDDLVDHFLYCGKRRPECYFDPAIRAGISSFANLTDPGEVDEGLARLRRDLASGRFAEVAAAHPTPDGDYLFVRAAGSSAPTGRPQQASPRRASPRP
jgi:ubiquinone/menaquinone biosynthesis C-methylase UbiE